MSKEIQVTIKGRTPLLMNRFTDEAAMNATNGSRSSIASGSKSPREVAEPKLYVSDDGTIGIPQPNLFRCVIDAGKFFKVGKSKVTTLKSSLIPACVDIGPIFVPLVYADDWTVDSRPVRNPATGGRFLTHRPCFNDWQLTFDAELDEDTMAENLFREIIDAAGSKIGLGDFRPDTKGPFGKFTVIHLGRGVKVTPRQCLPLQRGALLSLPLHRMA